MRFFNFARDKRLKPLLLVGNIGRRGKRQIFSKNKVDESGKILPRDAQVKAGEFIAQIASGTKLGDNAKEPKTSNTEALPLG